MGLVRARRMHSSTYVSQQGRQLQAYRHPVRMGQQLAWMAGLHRHGQLWQQGQQQQEQGKQLVKALAGLRCLREQGSSSSSSSSTTTTTTTTSSRSKESRRMRSQRSYHLALVRAVLKDVHACAAYL